MVGCEIYGHYVGKENARLMGDEWVSQASDFFNEKTLAVPFKFVRWSELTAKQEYKDLFKQIQDDYEHEVDFRKIVDQLAEVFKKRKKCGFESARDYILDECAMYLMFDGRTTYPDKSLNLALQYVIVKYKKLDELQYIGYDIGNGKITQDGSENLSNKLALEAQELIPMLHYQSKMISELQQQVLELKSMMLALEKQLLNTHINSDENKENLNSESVVKFGFFN